MVNINKLTKGFKLKINKRKSNWRTLDSRESLPQTLSDEYMLYSDTEAELYQAKVNVEANRSFVSYTNKNENISNTNNILAGLNSNNNIGRSKTAYTRPSANIYRNNTNTPSQNSYLYQSIKNSSSNNSTPYTSVPNSPLSIDSYDTYINDQKINNNNPFKVNLNSTVNPKATTTEINTQLSIVTNTDPAYSHTLVSPIEFDGSGKEIKQKTESVNSNNNNNTNTNTTKDFPVKSKSIKKLKPLITFDIPPVVTPMAPESDSDEVGHRRRSKKSKKYSKKRHSPSLSMDTSDKEISKKSAYIYGSNKVSSYENTSTIASKVNRCLNSPTEEDDDVPLGIIQYKCLSSLLQESAPPNISSLQSNTKPYKSSNMKNDYGYISPTEKYDIPRFNNYSSYYHENYVI
jgi:hypothetical protein